jgi:hypothetical protein
MVKCNGTMMGTYTAAIYNDSRDEEYFKRGKQYALGELILAAEILVRAVDILPGLKSESTEAASCFLLKA